MAIMLHVTQASGVIVIKYILNCIGIHYYPNLGTINHKFKAFYIDFWAVYAARSDRGIYDSIMIFSRSFYNPGVILS